MRSYGQYCSVAKALDAIGDRWSLLIIRELLLQGPCRYTDLRNGLPGIATNLLSDRLRELEAAGLGRREEAAPPVATTLFRLTEARRHRAPPRGTLRPLPRSGARGPGRVRGGRPPGGPLAVQPDRAGRQPGAGARRPRRVGDQ